MMQGITALPGAQQGPQAQQAPGQATPFQALPAAQPQTPQAMTGQLQNLPPQQLLQMFANPADKTPKWAVVSAYAKAVEQQRLMDAARGQSAMQQSQMQAQQPPVAAQVMSQPVGIAQGFSGGGAVAFEDGGVVQKFSNGADEFGVMANPEQAAADALRVERGNRERQIKQLEDSYFYLRMQNDPRADQVKTQLDTLRAGPAAAPAPASTVKTMVDPAAAAMMQRQGPRWSPPSSARSGVGALGASGTPRSSANAPAPALAPAKPDKLAQIEEEYEAANKGLQALLGRQGQVDPELARLRQAAYESAQGIAARRERDRLAALEAAQKATGAPLLENQEALLRMAASLGGAKRFGEALSRAAGAAGEVRGEQRKALEAAQKMSREEQNAIDQLNQALAEKRVADRSGDVDRQRQAEIAVEQAKANLIDKRFAVQKERATEEDRAAQRETQRGQLRVAERRAAAEEKQIGRDPQDIQTMRILGIPLTLEGYKQYADIAKGYGAKADINRARLDQRRTELAAKDPTYQMARMAYGLAKTDEAKATALATMRRLEELNGIIDDTGTSPVGPSTTGQPTTSGVARPTSQAEFNALPKGTKFINPADGKEYVKN